MRSVTAIFAAGLLSLTPAIALAQHHQDNRTRPHGEHGGGGAPTGHPQGGHGQGGPYRGGPMPGRVIEPGRGGPGPGGRGGPYARGGGGGGRVSLDGVISQMHRRFPGGRMLDAGLENWGGRTVYRVRWSSGDGRRIDYLVDAQTGEIVGKED